MLQCLCLQKAKVTSAADGAVAAELACSAMHGPVQFLCLVPAHSLCNLAAGKSAAGKTAAAAKGGKNSGKVSTAGTLLLVCNNIGCCFGQS